MGSAVFNRLATTVLVGLLVGAPALGQQSSTAHRETGVTSSGPFDPQKVEQAYRHLERMREVVKQVLSRLEDARSEKDIVKLNCVNEKLTQVKGLLRVAEQTHVALLEAVAQQDDNAEVEYARIAIARTKVDQLRAEAEGCIGQLAFVVDQKTTVEVEQSKELPEGDVTHREPPPPPLVRPPAASPFQ